LDDLRGDVDRSRAREGDDDLLWPRLPESEDLLRFLSDDAAVIARVFLSVGCSDLECFFFDFVSDDLGMMIGHVKVMIFVVLLFL
jgi:hypothetical protein